MPTPDPKGSAGSQKPPLALLPPAFNEQTAKALQCGAFKYGPWNWRENKVEYMTYLHAMKRHIDCLLNREDIDPESDAHHLGHVAAGCAILLDARHCGTLIDNRPPLLTPLPKPRKIEPTSNPPHGPLPHSPSRCPTPVHPD